ncbi:MAG: glycosyltransferase family 2 protein [Bdellovibrionota bacterium]
MAASKIGLFIPAYNVEGTLVTVLEKIPPAVLSRLQSVWIIDNGSKDRTLELARQFVAGKGDPKFKVFQNERNYFLGGSTIIALKKAIEEGLDFLICMHSDGQANPEDLARFIELSTPEVGVVLGSRFMKQSAVGEYSRVRRLGNEFFIVLQQWILGKKVRDLGSFISFNVREVSKLPYDELPYDMGYQPLLLLLLLKRRDVRHVEFPISWGKVESTNVRVVSYGLHHLARLAQVALGVLPRSGRRADYFKTVEKSK